ncbi:MAG TPA: cytidylate kinase-like family protein [Isosphaeraceae bacterium]
MTPLDAFPAPEAGRASRLLSWSADVARRFLGRRSGRSPEAQPAEVVPRFRNLCISREAGAGGGLIGRLVATRLDWKLYNHEILEAIAHRMEVTAEEVEALDELAPSAIQDWLLPLREEYYAPQEAYLDHLAKLIEAIGRAGESVLVGRGSGYMLPRDEILSVRIIAPPRARAQHLAERMGVSVRTARMAVRDLDRRRARFARTMFRVDPADPHLYDLVLDSHSLSMPVAVEILVRAIQAGRPQGASPPPKEPARGGE